MNPLSEWPAFPIGKISLVKNKKGETKKKFAGGLPPAWEKTKLKVKDIPAGTNGGIVPGKGRIVTDLDKTPRFEEVKACLYRLKPTATQRTQGGGLQAFFNCPDAPSGNAVFLNDKAGELRKGNSFVVMPGSKTEQGTEWKLINSLPVATVTWQQMLDAFEPLLKEESKDAKVASLKEPDSKRGAREILASPHPGEHERVTCTMLLLAAARLKNPDITLEESTEGIVAVIDQDNQWKDYNHKISAKKIKGVLKKYFDKKNPKAEEQETKTKKIIKLPQLGKLISEFATEIAGEIKHTNTMFYRIQEGEIVEIGKVLHQKSGKEVYTGFSDVKPSRFVTLMEQHFIPGHKVWIKEKERVEFRKKSMSRECASTVLQSPMLQEALPQIERIFTIPLPIMVEGKLSFPKEGYDPNFLSWLPYDAPKITKPDMELKDAKDLIETLLCEFCFENDQDKCNAIAALITPYLRGLFSAFNVRTPVFFYLANREGIGKDYLSGLSGLLYEGAVLQEPPISTEERMGGNANEEFRKKILATMISGRKRFHSANNKGHINNAVLEAVVTAETYSDRKLGSNKNLTFDNEIDYSLSGNTGITYTADFARRTIFIKQFFAEENANKRKFKNPKLHQWVKKNRSEIISAMYCFVKNWVEKGKPEGKLPFASYPEWAGICGGVLESAGYASPCIVDTEGLNIGGDSETESMKDFFEACYKEKPEGWMSMNEIYDLIEKEELFDDFDQLDSKKKTKMGKILSKFVGRIFSEIKMEIYDKKAKGARRRFKFTDTTKEQKKIGEVIKKP